MKKLQDIIRPFLAIILGALLFLVYLNYLQAQLPEQATMLAIGIVAVIFAAFYVAIGILNIVLGFKIQGTVKKVLDVCCVAMFPVLMFVSFLITAISSAQLFGPTSWVILIVMLFASIFLALMYGLAAFAPNKVLKRVSSLFGSFFVLALLLDILFDVITGFPNAIGDISMVHFAIYFIYVSMLLNSLGALEEGQAAEPAPAQEEESAQEEPVQEEEQPAEEPAEEASEEPKEEQTQE